MSVTAAADTLRVLTIEDNPGDARLMRESLRESDSAIDLEHATTLAEGIATLRRGSVDAVLLDLSLPDSVGLDTVARVRQAAPDVPIVVMTSLEDERIAVRAVAEGAQDYLVKGVNDGVPRAIRYAVERHRLLFRLAEARKLEAIGRLSGALAHEFNNRMMTVLGYTELLEAAVQHDPKLTELTIEIRKAGERAAAVTRQMLAVGGFKRLRLQRLSLNESIRRLEYSISAICRGRAELAVDLAANPDGIEFDPAELANALSVLATNGCEAMPSGGMLSIVTGNDPAGLDGAKSTGGVTLSVRDEGIGMPPEIRDRLFEPFFKTKRLDQGTGLSLAALYGTLTEFGVALTVDTEPGRGSTFTLHFPTTQQP